MYTVMEVTPENCYTEFMSSSGSTFTKGKDPLYSRIHEGPIPVYSAQQEACRLSLVKDDRFNDKDGRGLFFWDRGFAIMDGDTIGCIVDTAEEAELCIQLWTERDQYHAQKQQ